MALRLHIPKELLVLHPNLSLNEIRALVMVIWKAKNNRTRQADIFRVPLKGIGVIRSRGNKRPKRRQKVLKKDRLRKRNKKLANICNNRNNK